jgi:DNA repair protein RAD7
VGTVDDAVLQAVASPHLRALHVRRCSCISDAGVAAVATQATRSLKQLALSETPVTSAALEQVAVHCPELELLSMRKCMRVKDAAALIAIAQNGKLQSLDVAMNRVATGALAVELAASCAASLRTLDISFCRLVEPETVGYLLDSCQGLEDLKVFGCSQLTRACLRGHTNEKVRVWGEPTFEGDGACMAALLNGAERSRPGQPAGMGAQGCAVEAGAPVEVVTSSDSMEVI